MASIFLTLDRSVHGTPTAVRECLKTALRELHFEVITDQVTLIEAKRGSRFGGTLLGTERAAVALSATVTPSGDACTVHVRLADNMASPVGRTWGMNTTYQRVFGQVQEGIDRALGRLDPAASAQFAPAEFTSKTGTIGVLESTNRAQGSIAASATSKVNEMLSGGPATRVPEAWKKLDTVVFMADEGAARMDLEETQAHLAVAAMITAQPDAMPPALAAQVAALATRVETALTHAGEARYVEIRISDDEEPVVAFLHQQARLRELLPVRTLHRCRTCRFEKITNPDYERLQKRNSRLRAIGGSAGASFGSGGVRPFILVGTLMRFAKLDPDYVCPRCQGIDAEALVVTFCPQCGALRTEAALRTCAKCKLDLRTKLTPEEVWEPYPPVPALASATPALPPPPVALPGGPSAALPGTPSQLPGFSAQVPPAAGPVAVAATQATPTMVAPPPPPPPPATPVAASMPRHGPNGGKLCEGCGREFASLYRVVVAAGAGAQVKFVCGQPPDCDPRSVETPRLV